jgi:hypothetical protein
VARFRSLIVGMGAALPLLLALPANGAAVQGVFVVSCGFSHRAADDPIVYPGEPGASHSHDFFGNISTNASSTYESLIAAGTTCKLAADTATYWMPTVYKDGAVLDPLGATIYYRNVAPDVQGVVAFPPGFRMIAGDAHTTSAQRPKYVGWACRRPSGRKGVWTSDVPLCAANEELVFRVAFPECWNGVDLDSIDHSSHVARITRQGVCPSGYPVYIPRVSMTVAFNSQGGDGITLSSGTALTGHMDFINSWDQAVLESLVEDCLRARQMCGFVTDP